MTSLTEVKLLMSEQALPRGKAQPTGGTLLAAQAAVRGTPVIPQAVRLSVALPTRLTRKGEGPVHSQVMLADQERAPDLVCD